MDLILSRRGPGHPDFTQSSGPADPASRCSPQCTLTFMTQQPGNPPRAACFQTFLACLHGFSHILELGIPCGTRTAPFEYTEGRCTPASDA